MDQELNAELVSDMLKAMADSANALISVIKGLDGEDAATDLETVNTRLSELQSEIDALGPEQDLLQPYLDELYDSLPGGKISIEDLEAFKASLVKEVEFLPKIP